MRGAGFRALTGVDSGFRQDHACRQLDHCVIHVSDWERSNAFYRDVLGAELVRRPTAGPTGSARRSSICMARASRRPRWRGCRCSPATATVLRMEGPIATRSRISALQRPIHAARSSASAPRAGHQRLFPRSRRLAARIHLLRRRRTVMTIRTIRPCCRRLPVPQDDGAAPSAGMKLPSMRSRRPTVAGRSVELPAAPWSTSIRAPACPGSHAGRLGRDPGARGCTPQSCSFRDHFAELKRLGVAQRVRPVDAGQRLSARGGRAAASAVPGAVRRRLEARRARSSCRPSRSPA